MPESLKIGVGLLILVSIFFLCLSIALFFTKESEREKKVALEAELDKVLEAKDELRESLDELRIVNKDLEAKLASSRQEIKALAQDHTKEKQARELLMADLEKEKKEVKDLVDEIMGSKEEKVGLVQKLAQAETDYQALREQLNVIVQAKETLEQKVRGIISQKGVELEKIVVAPDSAVATYPETEIYGEDLSMFVDEEDTGVDGEVLIVNKKFNFVVVNLGKTDGLRIGDYLEVYRQGKMVAEAQVEKLYARMSAATLLPEYERAGIKTGDEVLISR